MTVTPGEGETEQTRSDDQPRADERLPADQPRADDQPRIDAQSGPDEQTQVGPPPAFPSVGGAPGPSAEGQTEAQPLFTSPGVEPEWPQADGAYVTSVAPARSQDAGGPGGRWRWIVAAVATVAVIALVAGIFFFAPRAGAPSVVSLYAPADSVAYVELRLDLPGDQRDQLISFMSKFPGFADPATFEQKINDTLQQALRASNSGLDWNADVAPWFGGQVGMFTGTLTPGSGTPPSFTAALTVKDRTRLDELVNARVAQAGAQQEDYKGQTVWTVSSGEHRLSLAVTDEVLLASTRIEDLKAALDVKAGQVTGLATDEFFSQQMSALHADRLAAFYADYEALNEASLDDLPQSGFFGDACIDNLTSASNFKLVAEIRAEADHLAVTSRMSAPSVPGAPPLPANRQTALAEAVPNSTVAYFELRDVGAGIKFMVEQALACLDTSTTLFDTRAVEQFLGVPPQEFFDFVQDVAIAVTYEAGQPGGGLIATVDDENVARLRMERLLSTVRGLAALGGGLVVEEQQHGDATITILRAEGLPEGTPVDSVALTVSGGRLYLGVGDFVTGALDRAASDSLAGSERYRTALSAAGAENAGMVYVDMTAIRGVLESLMTEADRTKYETEVKPFVEPFSYILFANRTADGMVVGTYFVYVE